MRRILHIALILSVLCTKAISQTTIEICPDEIQRLEFDQPASGRGNFEWYTRLEDGGSWLKRSTQSYFDLDDIHDARAYQVYGLDLSDDCQVIVTDTFTVVPSGKIHYFRVLNQDIEDPTDLVVKVKASPFLMDTSQIIINEPFQFLLNPDEPGSPDSLMIEFASSKRLRITEDTTDFIIPIESFKNEVETAIGVYRPLDYTVYAYWNNCGQIKEEIPLSAKEYSDKNFISRFSQGGKNFTFFASGLIDEMYGGDSPGKLMGLYNRSSDSLKNVSVITNYRSSNPFDSTLFSFVKLDSIEIAPKDFLFYKGSNNSGDSIIYPPGLQSEVYQVGVESFDFESEAFTDGGEKPFLYRNPDDQGPFFDLNLKKNPSLRDTSHVYDLEFSSSLYAEYFSPIMDLYFTSPNNRDTTESQRVFLPSIDFGDTLNVEIDLLTFDNTFRYDSVHYSFKNVDGLEVKTGKIATQLRDIVIEPRNGIVYQTNENDQILKTVFIGDTLVSTVPRGNNSDTKEIFDFSKSFQVLPGDSSYGEFYALESIDSTLLNYSLNLNLTNFYDSALNEEDLIESIEVNASLYGETFYHLNGRERKLTNRIKDLEKVAELNLSNNNNQLEFQLGLLNQDFYQYIENIRNGTQDISIDSIKFKLITVLSPETEGLATFNRTTGLSDSITLNIDALEFQNKLSLDMEVGIEDAGDDYFWSDDKWGGPNKRVTERFGDTYDIKGLIVPPKQELDIPIDEIQVGIYEITPEFLGLLQKRERFFFNELGGFLIRDGSYNVKQAIGIGRDSNMDRFNQLFTDIHMVDSLFKLSRIDTLANILIEGSDRNVAIPVPFKREVRGHLIVVDPNNHIKESNEMNNMELSYIFPYHPDGADLDIPYAREPFNPEGRYELSSHKFMYRGKELQLFHAQNQNYDVDESNGKTFNDPDIPETFELRRTEPLPIKLAIANEGNYSNKRPFKLVFQIKEERFGYSGPWTVTDTLEISDALQPLTSERLKEDLFYINYELTPGDYVSENNSFDLRAFLLYEDDEDLEPFALGFRDNIFEFNVTRFIIKSPNLAPSMTFPEGDVENTNSRGFYCGNTYEVNVKLFNNSENAVDDKFNVILRGLEEEDIVVEVDGIEKRSAKDLTFNFTPKLSTYSLEVRNKNLQLIIDLEKDGTGEVYTESSVVYGVYPVINLATPSIKTFNGFQLSWRESSDENVEYYWEADYVTDSGERGSASGITTKTSINLNEEGFNYQFKHGLYWASVYAKKGDCEFSEIARSQFELASPPPSTGGGSGGSGGNSGGGSDGGSGGGSSGGSSSFEDKCWTSVTSSASVSEKQLSDYKYQVEVRNFSSSTVRVRFCGLTESGTWSCGHFDLSLGSSKKEVTYNPSSPFRYKIWFRDPDAFGCTNPSPGG